jgi:ribosomal protein L7Ae-like RNA K-turn-binding protein
VKLGSWLTKQRRDKKNRSLDENLEERLTNLGVVWDVFSQQWEDKYKLLEQYKEREGDCNVPRSHVEDGVKLGKWLTKQSGIKKNGSLDENLEGRLTNLGVVWDVLSQQWEDNFQLLVQYKEREGDCNVPYSHVEGGEKLGRWLSKQRTKKKNGKLDKRREERLNNLGGEWKK